MAGNNGGPQQPGGIREVARLAGVSVASASFALNGQPGVAEHTRQRILAAAEQLGYRANPQAQALRRGRTTTYGFVVRNFANPFFLDVLGGAEEVAEAAGATVLILDSRYSLDTSKLRSLDWTPAIDFAAGIRRTVDWYRDNQEWCRPLKSGEF